jgi:hypothetical protein
MRDLFGLPVADNDIGATIENWPDEVRDVGARILIVTVGVDDDICAQAKAGIDAGAEGAGQAAVPRMADVVVDPGRPRDLCGAVGGAVIDHQDLDDIDALDPPRNVRHRLWQRLLLVEARDLDDEFHCVRLVAGRWPKGIVNLRLFKEA